MYQTIGPDSKSGKEAAHMVTRAAKRFKISQSVSDDNTKTTYRRKLKLMRGVQPRTELIYRGEKVHPLHWPHAAY